jgi:hypothetical protein
MRRILDPAFRYRPSFATDVRETFAKARREQAAQPAQPAPMAATIASTHSAGGAETSIKTAPRGVSSVAS